MDPLRARDQPCRVARTPVGWYHGNLVTGNSSNRLDDFPIGIANAVAEIVDATTHFLGIRSVQALECKHVRLGDVRYVDVIADACPVGRIIVAAIEMDRFSLPHRDRTAK